MTTWPPAPLPQGYLMGGIQGESSIPLFPEKAGARRKRNEASRKKKEERRNKKEESGRRKKKG